MRTEIIKTLVVKEIEEGMKSKYVLLSTIGMPLLFAILMPVSMVLPLVFLDPNSADVDAGDLTFLSEYELTDNWSQLDEVQQTIILMIEFSMIMFILLPLIMPTVIAADTIAGEKDRNTSEGLVAAPITETEIYLGKVLGTVVPSILGFWISAIPFVILINWSTQQILGYWYYPNLDFILIVFVLGPLLGLISTNLMIWVSTKTSNTRDAQQLGSFVVLPMFFLIVGTIGFALVLSSLYLYIGILALIIINIFATKLGVNILDREKWVLRM